MALPEPRATTHQLLNKLTSQDDVEAYLHTFEVVTRREEWDQAEWAQLLAPLLTREPKWAYNSLSAVSANDYAILKTKILARVALSPICAAQKFHDWAFDPRVPIRVQAAQLLRLANLWLLHSDPQAADISERVVIDSLLRAIFCAHRRQICMTNPSFLTEVLEAVELSEAIQAREAGERAGPYPCKAPGERRSTESNLRPADLPAPQRDQDEPMPTDTNPPEI